MEKRVLLAVVLSFLVLYGFQVMFPSPEPQKPATAAQPPPPAASQPAAPGAATGQPSPASPQDPPAVTPAPAADAPAPLVADAADREVIVESESVRAVFSTRGAVLKSWRLKNYLDAGGHPLELVPQDTPADQPRPFTLVVDDGAVTSTLARSIDPVRMR